MGNGGGIVASRKMRAPPSLTLLRVVAWNAFWLVAGAGTAAGAAELWLRATVPFMKSSLPVEYVPNVGYLRKPNTEMRHTNLQDFWTVAHTNSLGFLDREPPSPERAARGCHVAVIGDSYVEAKEVPIDAKFHVVLERLAASALPALKITTAAYGRSDTGQIQQLPYYNEYARRLRPKLLVLVFDHSDFANNAPVLRALRKDWDPEHHPDASAERYPDGTMVVRPPDPDYKEFMVLNPPAGPLARGALAVGEASWLVLYLRAKGFHRLLRFDPAVDFRGRVEEIRQRPRYGALLKGWYPISRFEIVPTSRTLGPSSAESEMPPIFQDAVEYTAFALGEFKARADRDGAAVVVLAVHRIKASWPGMFARVSEVAASQGIPVVDQADYIVRQGARPEDAHWPADVHWNPDGHHWAAEALLEYLAERPHLCDG